MRIDISIRNCLNRIGRSKDIHELRNNLSQLLCVIQKGIELRLSDMREHSRVACKGLMHHAKEMDGKMAFVCGQYASTIDHMMDDYKIVKANEEINQLFGNKIVGVIATYLWNHKCSNLQTVYQDIRVIEHEENSIVYETIGIEAEEFEQVLHDMKQANIIIRDYLGDHEYIELSANGYEYMRRHYFEKEGINLW